MAFPALDKFLCKVLRSGFLKYMGTMNLGLIPMCSSGLDFLNFLGVSLFLPHPGEDGLHLVCSDTV